MEKQKAKSTTSPKANPKAQLDLAEESIETTLKTLRFGFPAAGS
jgi:hypothetical protein